MLIWSIPQPDGFLLNVGLVGKDEKVMKMVRGVECGCDMRLQPRTCWASRVLPGAT